MVIAVLLAQVNNMTQIKNLDLPKNHLPSKIQDQKSKTQTDGEEQKKETPRRSFRSEVPDQKHKIQTDTEEDHMIVILISLEDRWDLNP